MLDLAIVIVNYRTAALTIDSLEALMADPTVPLNTQIVVVDGASGDNSVAVLAEAISSSGWDDKVMLLPLEVNGGFSFGNNRGIEAVESRFGGATNYFLLNPDTVVRSRAVIALVDFLASHPEAGIAGSRLEDPDGTYQHCAFRFPTIAGEFESAIRTGAATRLLEKWVIAPQEPDQPCATDWVSGAAMMVRRQVLQDVGFLDENYFLYYEELDLCRRALNADWQSWYVPESRVIHLCGQSTGVTILDTANLKRRPAYWFESRKLYFSKHHSAAYTILADLGWLVGQIGWRARRAIERKPTQDPPQLVRDFLQNKGLRPRT